ncbi:MAG: ABC transporter permease [Candidatus Abyssobacteria bacterium SURF_5]|uniref:ABC transporter permease n=1 Tax=Abyssobacteria bacterium (strain SURF_5) TaxID=2093360 RepID=A0A3A4NRT1_ABYX5|nr:MAG: ABC transporter permease [Candidatus Abyssubacteria bacterium SURF_5]
MKAYIVRRLLTLFPLVLAMSFVTFMFIQLAPGDYFATLRLNPQISEETVARLEAQYHMDKPPIVQYGYWLKNIVVSARHLRLDLGYSISQKQPVSTVIASRLVNTLLLSISAILITWLVAIPIGIYSAVHQYSWGDKFFSALAFVGMSLPGFFLALLMLYYFGSELGILPIGGLKSPNYDQLSAMGKAGDMAAHLVIPTVVLAIGGLASLQRIMRGNMLEVLRMQYVTTARAKGLPEKRVIYRHALRNAINPMVTIFGFELSSLLSGAALLEIVCGYPGLGQVLLEAVRSQDIFLVMGSMLIGGVMLIVGNLVADVLLAIVDPQVSYQ